MSKFTLSRLGWLLGLIAAVLWLPWWLVVLTALGALFFESYFYELLLPAFLFDSLWGAPGLGWFGVHYLTTALALVLVYLFEQLKPRLRWL